VDVLGHLHRGQGILYYPMHGILFREQPKLVAQEVHLHLRSIRVNSLKRFISPYLMLL
jgi:hypothetical protein